MRPRGRYLLSCLSVKTLLLTAVILATPSSAETWWTLADKPDCLNPMIWISEETDELERPDFVCSIKDKDAKAGITTYSAECLTDLPSVEMFTVTAAPSGPGLAEITWRGLDAYFDARLYRLCPADENAVM